MDEMLGGHPDTMGSIEYRYVHCGEGKHLVLMSCQSSLCWRGAKVYVTTWVSRVGQILHDGIMSRHYTSSGRGIC
jgi:hypothetical protein